MIVIIAFICCLNAFSQSCPDRPHAYEASVKNDSITTLRIYPVPVSDVLYITGVSGCSEVKIIDVSGKVICCENITEDKVEINIENLQSGIYFVLLKKKENITVKKIVK